MRDSIPINSVAWSTGNAARPVNINAQVKVFGNASISGQITNDSIDGKLEHIFGFQWRPC